MAVFEDAHFSVAKTIFNEELYEPLYEAFEYVCCSRIVVNGKLSTDDAYMCCSWLSKMYTRGREIGYGYHLSRDCMRVINASFDLRLALLFEEVRLEYGECVYEALCEIVDTMSIIYPAALLSLEDDVAHIFSFEE